jgi:hypothetical protein
VPRGAPGEIIRAARSPFGVALPAVNLAVGQVVELGLLSAGSSNYDVELFGPTRGSQARKIMVRPERFDLPN